MKLFPDPSPNNPSHPPDNNTVLDLQNEIKTLELELHDREKSIERLSQELERLRLNQKDLLIENSTAVLEELYSSVTPALVQLVTQNYLANDQNKAVQPADILLVTERLIRILEQHGLTLVGQPGQQAQFDPNLHTPLSAASTIQAGQSVIIRFVGVSFHRKILGKAGVEPLEGSL